MIDGRYDYFAFISYKREDEKKAKWLQEEIESYGFPVALRKKNPSLPSKVRPVFRDQTDLSAGNLKEAIEKNLNASKFLIVICSPRSAKSQWVSKEVQYFIENKREAFIIPFIIGGVPNSENPEEECFPEGLRQLSGEKELLGIDANGDGREVASVKVIARMFNISFDTLWQRHERAKRRRRLFAIVSLLIFAIVCFSIGAYMTIINKQLVEERDKVVKANWKMLENRGKAVAEKANQLIDIGDNQTAQLLCLAVLPSSIDDKTIPYVPEVERAFRRALASNSVIIPTTKDVNYIALSNDDNMLAAVQEDGVSIWNVHTGESIKNIACQVETVAFSPDGKTLVTGDFDGQICLWDLDTGIKRDSLNTENYCIYSVLYSPSGEYIVSCDRDGFATICDSSLNDSIKMIESDPAIFSPDGKYLITSDYPDFMQMEIRVYDTDSWTCVKRFGGEHNPVEAMSITADGQFLSTMHIDDIQVRIWDLNKGICVDSVGTGQEAASSICFDQNSGKLAVGYWDGALREWDIWSEASPTTLSEHKGKIPFVVFGHKKNILVSCGWDKKIIIRDNTETSSPKIMEIPLGDFIALNKTLNSIAVAADGYVRIYDVGKDSLLANFRGSTPIEYSYLGTLFVARTYNVYEEELINIYDAKTLGLKHSLKVDANAIALSDNEMYMAILSNDNNINVYDLETQNCRKSIENNEYINAMALSPCGDVLAYATEKMVKVVNIANDQEICVIENLNSVNEIVFHPKDSVIITVEYDVVKKWDLHTGKCCGVWSEHISAISDVSFGPNGTLAVTGSNDGTIKVWDVATNVCIETIGNATIRDAGNYDQGNSVYGVCFSLDGKHILSEEIDNFDIAKIKLREFQPLQNIIEKSRNRLNNRQLSDEEKSKYYLK